MKTLYAQRDNNILRTFTEFVEMNPSDYCNFELKLRTSASIFMTGGISNYRVKGVVPESKKTDVTKVVWGIIYQGAVYINSFPYSKIIGYNEIIEKGHYSCFIGEIARYYDEQLVLGIITEGVKYKSVGVRLGYVIFPDGMIKCLKPEIMETILKENKTLLEEFLSMNLKQENVYEMFDFIQRINLTKK